MKRGYKSKHRKYIRYFIFGIILASVAFGSLGIRLGRLDTSEPAQCEPSNIYPDCNPGWMSKDYIRECWKGGPPCPLDAANSKDNDTIRSKTHEE